MDRCGYCADKARPCPECKATAGQPDQTVAEATRGHPDFDEERESDE